MSIEVQIATLLNGSATVIAATSSRIFTAQLPDRISYPAILVTRVLGEPINTLSGYLGVEKTRVQIDCFSTRYSAAFNLSTVVHRIMDGSGTFKNIQISNQDLSQPMEDMKPLYRISGDYSCWPTS